MEPAEIARGLDQPDVEQRRRAVLAMAGRTEPALAALLLRALADRDFRVREEAIWIGRGLCERLDLVPALLGAVSQGDNVGLRNAALALLKALGPLAQTTLLNELPRLEAGPRRLLIEGLGRGGDPRAVRMLAQAAESEDSNLVTAAIEGLALLGGVQAEAVLRKKLKAESPFERMASWMRWRGSMRCCRGTSSSR
jgi:HEAT repeat protein